MQPLLPASYVSFLHKIITANPRKNICCGKQWPKCHFSPHHLSWVGLALGWGVCRFHNNIRVFCKPNIIWQIATPNSRNNRTCSMCLKASARSCGGFTSGFGSCHDPMDLHKLPKAFSITTPPDEGIKQGEHANETSRQ